MDTPIVDIGGECFACLACILEASWMRKRAVGDFLKKEGSVYTRCDYESMTHMYSEENRKRGLITKKEHDDNHDKAKESRYKGYKAECKLRGRRLTVDEFIKWRKINYKRNEQYPFEVVKIANKEGHGSAE